VAQVVALLLVCQSYRCQWEDGRLLGDKLTLHSKAVEPLVRLNRPAADHRASSVYSQPGLETLRIVPHGSDRMLSVYSEVSPLTSPRASADFDTAESPGVSPIEPPLAPQEVPTHPPKMRSQLPIPRKVSPTTDPPSPDTGVLPGRRGSPAEGVGSKNAAQTVGLSKEEQLARLREKNRKLLSGFHERPSPNSKETIRPRRDDSLDHPVYREPWKGPSGRTALVEPVRNVPRSKHDLKPQPEKKNVSKDSVSHTVVTAPAVPSDLSAPTSLAAPAQNPESPEPAGPSDEQIKPIAPLKVGNNTTRVRSPVTAENLSSPFNPRYSDVTLSSQAASDAVDGGSEEAKVTPSPPERQEPLRSSESLNQLRPLAADDEPASRFSWTTCATSTPPPKTPENDPSSRFSWTTYATSAHESPRSIASRDPHAPPIPPVPYIPNAMAMRQRPTPSHPANINSISKPKVNRNPTPSSMSRDRSSSLFSSTTAAAEANKSPTTLDTPPADRSKSLPQCPPEVEAKDRIAQLEARMDVLSRRRRNINQILKELNSVIQPTSFASDLATKGEVKKTMKGLEDELSEIRVEEHHIGMTLHRALKKRDQENVYGYATGLWIKRVTS
jgi:hypothetical protein